MNAFLTKHVLSDHQRRRANAEEAALVWACLWAGCVVLLVIVGIVTAAAQV